MNLKTIVENWLKGHGYDGLFSEDSACACRLEDLMPCEEPGMECQPGYEEKCLGEPTEFCEGDCRFHVVEKRAEGGEG